MASTLPSQPLRPRGGNRRRTLAPPLVAVAVVVVAVAVLPPFPRFASSLSSASVPRPPPPPAPSGGVDDGASASGGRRSGKFDYDMVVIGAGAAGLMAAGTSAGLGRRTLLVDRIETDEETSGGASSSSLQTRAEPPLSPPESDFHLGGDCTNAACVPSKALRSAARVVVVSGMGRPIGVGGGDIDGRSDDDDDDGYDAIYESFRHVTETVDRVRSREDPSRILSSLSALDVSFVESGGCSFVSPHELRLCGCHSFVRAAGNDAKGSNNSTLYSGSEVIDEVGGEGEGGPLRIRQDAERSVTSKKFLIATGADPIVPTALEEAAGRVGLPLLTYRTLPRPGDGGGSDGDRISEGGEVLLRNVLRREGSSSSSSAPARVVVAGGGAAACELSQSLARLGTGRTGGGGEEAGGTERRLEVTVVAPSILPAEDVPARSAARTILRGDRVNLRLHRRVVDVTAPDESAGVNVADVVLDDGTTLPADVLLVAVGRSPLPSLQTLHLQNADVAYTSDGISVNPDTLRSITAPNVHAAGDCCDAVRGEDRRASHAAWTAFHAVRRAFFPRVLCPPRSTHTHVPRVTFVDPEIASVGLSTVDCIRRYGAGGFAHLRAYEEGTDRADADRMERGPSVPGYVELRVGRGDGRILGASACGPAAAEMINEVGLALTARLSCRDVARTIHAYPSHGYLLHRVALALATADLWGVLSTCGVLGGLVSCVGSSVERVAARCRRPRRAVRDWQAEGASREFGFNGLGREENDGEEFGSNSPAVSAMRKSADAGLSYLEASDDEDLVETVRRRCDAMDCVDDDSLGDFLRWLDKRPPSRWQSFTRADRRRGLR